MLPPRLRFGLRLEKNTRVPQFARKLGGAAARGFVLDVGNHLAGLHSYNALSCENYCALHTVTRDLLLTSSTQFASKLGYPFKMVALQRNEIDKQPPYEIFQATCVILR